MAVEKDLRLKKNRTRRTRKEIRREGRRMERGSGEEKEKAGRMLPQPCLHRKGRRGKRGKRKAKVKRRKGMRKKRRKRSGDKGRGEEKRGRERRRGTGVAWGTQEIAIRIWKSEENHLGGKES